MHCRITPAELESMVWLYVNTSVIPVAMPSGLVVCVWVFFLDEDRRDEPDATFVNQYILCMN